MTPEADRPRRSALYMPATNARAIAKARTLACDVVILDLEDAVAPDMKTAARHAAADAVRAGGFGSRELVVRVNAPDTPWGADDLAMVADARPDAVLLPKVRAAAELGAVAAPVPLWVMVETPAAALAIAGIAAVPGVAALVLGLNDLAEATGIHPGADRLPFQPLMLQAVLAARAHGVAVLDGVTNAIDDPALFAAEAAQARRFGFDGKTLIHPSQVAPCNAAFSPSPEEIARAMRIVAAFDDPAAADRGAIRVGGEMVERLHLARARRTLAQRP
ncbi:citrate lyase subunit beta/citryl-CoA lyase [Sphingomonas jejuensis]|uniref:Citrate lyase subunit beta/citryl-CoA lyase n=1 Tax=Sphingomonas jejuensis TaxID=904715 RepID=A0ABX0XML1_9SPHN|nr:CoA ester lyase [Sphingomonas jejuensis]NJC34433.1 citrate lyase subunit beta/citryl-CoA lyase [Sphingomonas jejuensis]